MYLATGVFFVECAMPDTIQFDALLGAEETHATFHDAELLSVVVDYERDHGRCVRCGGQRDLEFDHIIPVAMGGGSTARNVQLLCETATGKRARRFEAPRGDRGL